MPKTRIRVKIILWHFIIVFFTFFSLVGSSIREVCYCIKCAMRHKFWVEWGERKWKSFFLVIKWIGSYDVTTASTTFFFVIVLIATHHIFRFFFRIHILFLVNLSLREIWRCSHFVSLFILLWIELNSLWHLWVWLSCI